MKVLLVEDNEADAFLLQEMMAESKPLPPELLHAGTLEEALGLLKRTPVDVLLLDLSLPDATGVETVARASAASPGLAIIVLTGLDDEDTALRAMQEGAQDYLVKGKVDPALLGRAIRYALERKRAEAHARQLVREQVARIAAEASERRSRLVAEASRLLAAADDCEAVLPQVARLALPHLGDCCWIDLVRPEGAVQRFGVKAEACEARQWALPGTEADPVSRVVREGAPLMLTELPAPARDALDQPGLKALLSVPVTGRERPLGALTFLALQDGRSYQESDLALASELAGRVALALDNARLYQEARLALQSKDELLEALKRSNAELEQFAYVASHDLQEPLRTVSSYIQLLARRYRGKLDDDADEYIRFAVDGATRMKRLIGDLLDYSRVSTRGLNLVPTDVQAVLENVLRSLELAIRESGAEISTAAPLPVVLGDEGQLEQLLQNLIDNAIKFRGPQAPRIHVSAERQGAHCLFRVKDNGIGIDPQYFERIFVIFQRLHGSHEYPGTGIGLATARRIVERHGGRLWVDSTPGQGTTFSFTLPAPTAA